VATRTYHGSCHCGAVRFESEIDLAAGTAKCNCSYCAKVRNWSVVLKPAAFRLLAGEDALAEYRFGTRRGRHRFCRTCGVHPFSQGHVEEIGGDFVSVQLGCLDDAAPEALAAAPVHVSNGRNNDWMHPPAITAHL
jgi:hypothetical protein